MSAIFGGSTLRGSQATRSLAEAEVAAPTDKIWREFPNNLRQAETPRPAGLLPNPRLEGVECLWRNAPLGPVVRDAEAQEFPLLWSVLFVSLTVSRSFVVRNRLTEAMTRSPAR